MKTLGFFTIFFSPETEVTGGGNPPPPAPAPADEEDELDEETRRRVMGSKSLAKRPIFWILVAGFAALLIWTIWPESTPKVDQAQVVADSTARADSIEAVAVAKTKTADSLKVIAAAKVTTDSLKAIEVAKANKKTTDSTTVAAKPATTKPDTTVTASAPSPKKGPLATQVEALAVTVANQGQRIDGLGQEVKTLDGRVGKLETTTVQLVATTDFLVLREAIRYSQAKNAGETVQADIDAFKAATIAGRDQMLKALKK